MNQDLKQGNETILHDRFKLLKPLGKGKFSFVYKALDLQTKNEVAVKMQKKNIMFQSKSILYNENTILLKLKNLEGVPINKLFIEGKDQDLLILPLYEETLRDLHNRLGSINLKSVLILALELVDILENVHSKNIIHLDLKPENIMVGSNDSTFLKQIFLIDYGLSKLYIDEITQKHITMENKSLFEGTLSYSSLNCHMGLSLSRRDDLESLGYILIEMLKGSLPWQHIHEVNIEERFNIVKKMKEEMKIEKLCKGIPKGFCDYFKYVKNMKFEEKPDYNYLKEIFHVIMREYRYIDIDRTKIYEWIQKENDSTIDSDEEVKEISWKNYKNEISSPSKSIFFRGKIDYCTNKK